MYARLISFSEAHPEKREKAVAGYLALYDTGNLRAKAIILWENEEAAESAEQTLAERRRQLAGSVGFSVESADLYEVALIEVEGARL